MIQYSQLCLFVAIFNLFLIFSILFLTMPSNFFNGLFVLGFSLFISLILSFVIIFHDDSPVWIDVSEKVSWDTKFFHFLESFVQTWVRIIFFIGMWTLKVIVLVSMMRWHLKVDKKIYKRNKYGEKRKSLKSKNKKWIKMVFFNANMVC